MTGSSSGQILRILKALTAQNIHNEVSERTLGNLGGVRGLSFLCDVNSDKIMDAKDTALLNHFWGSASTLKLRLGYKF